MGACTRAISVCLAAGVILGMPAMLRAVTPPVISARAAIAMDAGTGAVLFAHNPDLPLPPASTTKIVTALLLARISPSTPILATPAAVSTPGLTLGMQPLQKYSARTLLYAMLLKSANDAAVAVGQALGPGIPAFTAKMNRLAASAGATHSHFVNPDGLDAPAHLASARDLALIARLAMQNPTFAKAVGTRSAVVSLPGGRTQRLVNSDTLLRSFPGVEGIKTGYTTQAGYCFVGEAKVHGRQIITVVLHSTNWQQDTRTLLRFAEASAPQGIRHGIRQATKTNLPQALHHPSPMIGRATPPGVGPTGFTDTSQNTPSSGIATIHPYGNAHSRAAHWNSNPGSSSSTSPASGSTHSGAPGNEVPVASGPGGSTGVLGTSPTPGVTPAGSKSGQANYSGAIPARSGPADMSRSTPTSSPPADGKVEGAQLSNGTHSQHAHTGTPQANNATGSATTRRGTVTDIPAGMHQIPGWLWWMLLVLVVLTLLTNLRRIRTSLKVALPRFRALLPQWRYRMKTKGFPWNRTQSAPLSPAETPVERPAKKTQSNAPEIPPLLYDAEPPSRCASLDWLGKLASTPPRLLESSVIRHARAVLDCAQPSHAATLLPLLQAPTAKIRTSAATLLIPYAPRKSEEVLLAAMQDEKSGADLRAECAATLARQTGDRHEKTWVQLLLGDGFLPAATALATLPWLDDNTTRALKHVLEQDRQLQTDSEVVLRTNTRDTAIAGVLALHGHIDGEILDAKLHELPARQRENIISALFLESDHPLALKHALHAVLHSKSGYAIPALMRAKPSSIKDLLDAAEERADAAEKTRIMIVRWLLFKQGDSERVQKLAAAGNDLAVAASAIAQHSHWQPESQEANVLTAAARIVSLRLGYGDYSSEEISRAFRRASAEEDATGPELPAGLQELSQAYQHPEVYTAVQSALRSEDGIEQIVMALAKQHSSRMAMQESLFWSDKLSREFRIAHIAELASETGDEPRTAVMARSADADSYIRLAAHRALSGMPETLLEVDAGTPQQSEDLVPEVINQPDIDERSEIINEAA